MAKRLTDTDLWKSQRWFRKLDPIYKLAFCYIKDQCDHAGIWKIDCSDLIEDLGIEEFDIQSFVKSVNTEYDKISGNKAEKERIVIVGNNLWLTGFIQFQYESKDGKVNQDTAPVRTAFLKLQGLDVLVQGIRKGYIKLSQPLSKGKLRAKDISILKDIDILENTLFTQNENLDEEKPPERKLPDENYDTFPKKENYENLPQQYFSTAMEYVSRIQNFNISDDDVGAMWRIFCQMYLNGKRYYANDDEIYNHFLNWIKTQKFENGKSGKQSVAERQQSGQDALLNRGKRTFIAARK